jgi:hypothetical protein
MKLSTYREKLDGWQPGCLKGYTPENWLCVDCGVNTAPGLRTRVEMETAFRAGADSVNMTFTDQSEVYTVKESVWKRTGLAPYGGCLCIGCLENRIGRKLTPKDFSRKHPFNSHAMPATTRLQERRLGSWTR